VNKKANFTEGGVANASKVNMREFLTAVLVDNDKNQRMLGLQDQDVAEIYEQSVEIMTLNEEVGLVIPHPHSSARRSLFMRSARE
jgi:hypothetical protein